MKNACSHTYIHLHIYVYMHAYKRLLTMNIHAVDTHTHVLTQIVHLHSKVVLGCTGIWYVYSYIAMLPEFMGPLFDYVTVYTYIYTQASNIYINHGHACVLDASSCTVYGTRNLVLYICRYVYKYIYINIQRSEYSLVPLATLRMGIYDHELGVYNNIRNDTTI